MFCWITVYENIANQGPHTLAVRMLNKTSGKCASQLFGEEGAQMFKTSAVCNLHAVYILPLVHSLQSAVRSLRLTLTDWRIPKFILIEGSLSNHDGDGNEESNRFNKVRSHQQFYPQANGSYPRGSNFLCDRIPYGKIASGKLERKNYP